MTGLTTRLTRLTAPSSALLRAGVYALLVVLALWTLVPIVVIAVHALATHQRLTGADGILGADQLQYLSWARDAGLHGLASDLFELKPSGHVYLEPIFAITGWLWRLGVPLAVAYWVWKPIAIAVLFVGTRAWTRRLLPGGGRDQIAALTLALFMLTPIASLTVWVAVGSGPFRSAVGTVGSELQPAVLLWGYLPSAIAIGLMPIAILACERALTASRLGQARGSLGLACGCGLVASWVHPWQGAVLLLVMAGLAAWEGWRAVRALALPAVATALPLAYYELLPHIDAAWKLASHNEIVAHPEFLGLVAGLAPLLILAALGVRRQVSEPAERALLLWIVASLIVYFALNTFPSHALGGLSLPLAVLIVRGWRRLRLPALVGAAAIALVTVPGLVYWARELHRVGSSPVQEYYLNRSESRALDWVRRDGPPGGVLAPVLLAVAIPSQTDRPVWVGHEFWSRDYGGRLALTDGLFNGTLPAPEARALVAVSGARLIVSSCAQNANLSPALGGLIASVRKFGCATVYVVR